MTINCKCGYRVDEVRGDIKTAEVIADRHEASDVRRPHRHETIITEFFFTNYWAAKGGRN